MATDFNQIVQENTNNLLRWRERYSPEEYSSKVVLNLFYDLIPLEKVWDRFKNSLGEMKYNDINKASDFVYAIYRENQLSLQPVLVHLLKDGVIVGELKSKSYDKLIISAQNKSNEAVEEIEYAYIVYDAIKASFLDWFSHGMVGSSKQQAFEKVFNIHLPVSDWNSFQSVFQCFAQTTTSEIAGLSGYDGKVLTKSLYKPLPDLW